MKLQLLLPDKMACFGATLVVLGNGAQIKNHDECDVFLVFVVSFFRGAGGGRY